jgi:membrane-bound ClpP family serine protease
MRDSLIGLAQAQGYPPLLFRGMLDKNLTLYRVRSQKGQSEWRLLTEEEWEADQAGEKKWGNRTLIKAGGPDGRFLKLPATLAKELGVAQELVADVQSLYKHYGLKGVRDVGPDWLDAFASFLRLPVMAVFLVMVGITCLILELKMPGVGLPGVIAALCFVLYFWAHSQLAGQITMLAVLLFVLGLILIALEIFVLPGFGVTGISGILLVVVSLGLVTLEKKPETTQEWLNFGKTLTTFGLGLLGAVAAALLLAWYLPHIPYANRLMLKPPTEEDEIPDPDAAPAVGVSPALAALLGAIGVAVTPLRPAGMARFGEEFVDVVAEGSFVPAGNRVQVIEIEGNRVVVKEV